MSTGSRWLNALFFAIQLVAGVIEASKALSESLGSSMRWNAAASLH
jgi:hypothetical protein